MHNDKQKEHKNVFNWKLKIKLHRPEKIVAAESVSKLEKEILALPESQKLLTYNEYDVYFSSAFQTPAVRITSYNVCYTKLLRIYLWCCERRFQSKGF